jgi:hypothetical protein
MQGQRALEQLSLPFFFATDPLAFQEAIARNTEAYNVYGATRFGLPRNNILSNPAFLARVIHTYLGATAVHPVLRNRAMARVTQQALDRIGEVEADQGLWNDEGSLGTVFDTLKSDLQSYTNAMRTFRDLLFNAEFQAMGRFAPNKQLPPCEDQPGYPSLQSSPNVRNRTSTELVPPELRIAQSIGYIHLGECYRMGLAHDAPGVAIEHIDGRLYFPIKITVSYFYNDKGSSHDHIDPNSIAQHHINDSVIFRTRSIIAPQRITTQWDNSNVILPKTWTGVAEGDRIKIAECWRRTSDDWVNDVPNCTVPPMIPPVQTFLDNSTEETITEEERKQKVNRIMERVRPDLNAIVEHHNSSWDAALLSETPPITLGEYLGETSGFTSSVSDTLKKSLKDFTSDHLYAMGKTLQGLWHQVPSSKCAELLTDFSPNKIVQKVSDEMLGSGRPVVEEFENRRADFLRSCKSGAIHPELRELRKRLNKLKNQQETAAH